MRCSWCFKFPRRPIKRKRVKSRQCSGSEKLNGKLIFHSSIGFNYGSGKDNEKNTRFYEGLKGVTCTRNERDFSRNFLCIFSSVGHSPMNYQRPRSNLLFYSTMEGGDWYSNPTSIPNLIEFCNEG